MEKPCLTALVAECLDRGRDLSADTSLNVQASTSKPQSSACRECVGSTSWSVIAALRVFSASRLSCFFLPWILPFFSALVATCDHALQLLGRWWRFPAYSSVPLHVSRKLLPAGRTSPTHRANSLAKVLPLVLFILYIGDTRFEPSAVDVTLQAGWGPPFVDTSVLTSLGAQSGWAVGGADRLAFAKARLIKGFATNGGQEPSHVAAPAADAVVTRRNAAALLSSSIAILVKYASVSLPVLTLGADAAEASKKQGAAASAARGAAGLPVGEPAVSPAEERPAAVGAPLGEVQAGSSAFPSDTTLGQGHPQKKQQDRSSRSKASGSSSASPLCPMSNIASAAVREHVEEQLLHGTQEEQLRAVRELSRAHVTTWTHLPIDQLHAERLPGGLTNRLYVVQVRPSVQQEHAGEIRDTAEHSSTPRKEEQEAPQLVKQPSRRSEGAVEHGESGRRGEKVEDGEEPDVGISAETTAAGQKGAIRPDKILFRVFGQPDSLHLFDPERERVLFRLLSAAGLAPECFAEFPGGRIEGWIEGAALRVEELQAPQVQEMIAIALSKFHEAQVGYGRLCCSAQVSYCPWRQVLPPVVFAPPPTSAREAHVEPQQWGQRLPPPLRCQAQLEHAQQQPQPEHPQHQKAERVTLRQTEQERGNLRHQRQEAPTPHVPAEACRTHPPHRSHDSTPRRCSRHDEPDAQACTCSLCRGRDWALLARLAATRMKAAAARAQARAEAAAPAHVACCAASASAGGSEENCASAAAQQEARQMTRHHPPAQVQQVLRSDAGTVKAAGQAPGGENVTGDVRGEAVAESNAGASAGGRAVVERQRKIEGRDTSHACAKYYAAATAARQMRASVEAYDRLNLRKYEGELSLLKEAIRKQIIKEQTPGELERVYGGVDNWLLLSGGSPVLSHNDIQENNIMSTATGLQLIDFEYAGENLRAADLGNVFCEMTINYVDLQEPPYFTVDPSKFPSLTTRRSMISKYLRAVVLQHLEEEEKRQRATLLGADEKEEIVDYLVNEKVITNFEIMTRLLVLASHLVWSFWSVVKAPVPQPADEFDYLEYARQRLELYHKHKEEFFSSAFTSHASPDL